MADSKYSKSMGKTPIKLKDNGDSTYSPSMFLSGSNIALTDIMVPVAPATWEILDTATTYAIPFCEHGGTIYCQRGTRIYTTTDMQSFTLAYDMKTANSAVVDLDGIRVTRSGKIIVATRTGTNSGGQLWVADTVAGPYTLKLQLPTEGKTDGVIRAAAFELHSGPDKDVLIVGTYGNTGIALTNELYLSLDEGATLTKIFEPSVVDAGRNMHIHAAAWDPWYNWIWVCVGDGKGTNAGIWYSPDLGATWVQYTNQFQPTALVCLGDRVAFGNDDTGWPAGIYSWLRPTAASVANDDFSGMNGKFEQSWHRPGTTSGTHIPRRSTAKNGLEAVIGFAGGDAGGGAFLVATADGGRSWHQIYANIASTGAFYNVGVTYWVDDYLYAVYGNNQLLRIKWPTWKSVKKAV